MNKKIDWNQSDITNAHNEGWNIFECGSSEGGKYQIQRIDEAELFQNDEDAIKCVIKKAKEGGELHQKAIDFIKENNLKEFGLLIRNGYNESFRYGFYVGQPVIIEGKEDLIEGFITPLYDEPNYKEGYRVSLQNNGTQSLGTFQKR